MQYSLDPPPPQKKFFQSRIASFLNSPQRVDKKKNEIDKSSHKKFVSD